MQAAVRSRACAVCEGTDLRPHMTVAGDMGADGLIPTTEAYGTALADIVRCATCGHMQVDPMPSDGRLAEGYAEAESDDYVEEEAGQRVTAAAVLERIEAHRPPGDLLDVGAWVGFLCLEAERRGWRAVGLEPSEFASARARDRLGLDVRTAGLEHADLEPASFDAVVLGDVIEHLPRPAESLERIAALLRPGGVICLMIPDAGSRLARTMGPRWWAVLPTHVQYFTRDGVARLLERKGFRVVEVNTQPKAFTVRYYLERIGGYSGPLSRGLVATARRAGLAERMWAPDFGDRMLVIARRLGNGE